MMANNKKVSELICDIVDSSEMALKEASSLAATDRFSILLKSLMIKKNNGQLQLRATTH